jgi:decaprenyl-phosphate phosphoribosyltransferase
MRNASLEKPDPSEDLNATSGNPFAFGRPRDFLALIRPHHWLKNLFLFIPVFFGGKFLDPVLLLRVLEGFAAFSLMAGSVYIINDLIDLKADRMHPEKCRRPLASGRVGRRSAQMLMAFMAVAGLGYAALLEPRFFLYLSAYFALNLAYSFKLKHVAIVDICIIAIGFFLRIMAGGALAGIHISKWLVIMTFLIALFLGLAKRRDDVLIFIEKGERMRVSLDGYNLEFINSAMTLMAAVTLVSYIMYTVSPDVVGHMGESVYLSAFFVILGLLRYLQITLVYGKSGSPTRVLLRDRFIQLCLAGWVGFFAVVLYWGGR